MMGDSALRDSRGYSLVELLTALAITLAIAGAALVLVGHVQSVAQVQPEMGDMQQRFRVAVDALDRTLLAAGGGQWDPAGPSGNVFPSVMPYRAGSLANDVRAGVRYRPDAISIVSVTSRASQAILATSMPDPTAPIEAVAQPACPAGDPLCGFRVGMHAVISDRSGTHDVFEITALDPALRTLHHDSLTFQKAYEAGARVSEARLCIWSFDDSRGQLRYSDGIATDLPLVDNVVGLQFAYFGEALAPLDPAGLQDGPWWGAGLSAFDADLLRIRTVRALLRVQAAVSTLRGLDPLLFRRPGTARGGAWFLSDLSLTIEVSPRSLLWVRSP